MIPGQNLLKMAMTIIGKQTFLYFAYLSRQINSLGYYVCTYAAAVHVQGSVQPVPRTLYAALGLDFQKDYFNFFVPQDIYDVSRDVAGDQFKFQGKNFQCVSKTSWYGVDGWDQILCVAVPNV